MSSLIKQRIVDVSLNLSCSSHFIKTIDFNDFQIISLWSFTNIAWLWWWQIWSSAALNNCKPGWSTLLQPFSLQYTGKWCWEKAFLVMFGTGLGWFSVLSETSLLGHVMCGRSPLTAAWGVWGLSGVKMFVTTRAAQQEMQFLYLLPAQGRNPSKVFPCCS